MQSLGDKGIKGGGTELKGYYDGCLIDNMGTGRVKTPWNPRDSKAFLIDFWQTKSKNIKERWTETGHFLGNVEQRWGGKHAKSEQARLLQRAERLAGYRVNDVVKLVFLDGEQLGEIDGLDLGALKEFKRSGNGVVELKLVDRAAVLERLVELSGGREDGAEEFFRALRGSTDAA